MFISFISFISSCTALFTSFTLIITTSTALIQRDISESQCRGPHCTKTSNHHPTPRHRHTARIWTCSTSTRNLTLSTIQNSMYHKKKGRTDTQQHALNPFIEIDFFQDPKLTQMAKRHKLTPFKTLILCINLDSFQDPYILHPNWTHYRIPAVNSVKHNLIQSFQDPHIRFQQCFNLHGKLSSYWQCKISMGDYLQWQTLQTLYTVNFWLFCENKKKDTLHANNQHISRP